MATKHEVFITLFIINVCKYMAKKKFNKKNHFRISDEINSI